MSKQPMAPSQGPPGGGGFPHASGDAAFHRRAILGGLLGAAGAAALAPIARGGPLDPPAGPVSPTAKPLAEIEPRRAVNAAHTPGDATAVFVISQPGSYYLIGNIDVPSGKAGLRIAASGVTLDLMGFRISGGLNASTTGITDGGASRADIAIRGGSIVRVSGTGVSLLSTVRARLDELTVRDNGGSGVLVGTDSEVFGVICVDNGAAQPLTAHGILASDQSTVCGCIAAGNRGSGIITGQAVRIERCVSMGNTGSGVNAVVRSSVVGCVCGSNSMNGVEGGSVIAACTAGSNGARGVAPLNSSWVDGCAARANQGAGFVAGAGSRITRCAASGGASAANSAHGFHFTGATGMECCASTANAGFGVLSTLHGRVVECVTHLNRLDGIVTTFGQSLIIRNTCTDNGTLGAGTGAGIRVADDQSRVESNLCSGNSSFGIHVTGANNLVTRNACSLNAINWNLTANTIFGPVVDRTSPASPGVSGSGTAASTVGSADPHANISF